MARAAFVVNRTRVGDAPSFCRTCRGAAAAAGWEPLIFETARARDGLTATRRAISAGAGLVVAAGGDGTVRACAEVLRGGSIPLGIVPLGTANIAAMALGLPRGRNAALEFALKGGDRRIDVGVADGRAFVAMAGIGLDAEVVQGTPAFLRERLGWVGYALAGLLHLRGRTSGFVLRLDGGRELRREARAVVVGNAGLLPGGFPILPAARLDDGFLDVGILTAADLPGWARVGWRVLTHSGVSDGLLEHHRARRVEIGAATALRREVDGEPLPAAHSLSVRVDRGALIVRAPAPGQAP